MTKPSDTVLCRFAHEIKNLPYIKEWIEELQSGKYQQGNYRLIDKQNRRCCLGVYAELHPDYERNNHFYKKFIWNKDEIYGYRYISELSYNDLSRDLQSTLITLNDTDGCTFNEIADRLKAALSYD